MRNDEDKSRSTFDSLEKIGLSSNCDREFDSRAGEEIETESDEGEGKRC